MMEPSELQSAMVAALREVADKLTSDIAVAVAEAVREAMRADPQQASASQFSETMLLQRVESILDRMDLYESLLQEIASNTDPENGGSA